MTICTEQQAEVILRWMDRDEQRKFAAIAFLDDPEGVTQDALADVQTKVSLAFLDNDSAEIGRLMDAAMFLNSMRLAPNISEVRLILALRIAAKNIPQQAHQEMVRRDLYPKIKVVA